MELSPDFAIVVILAYFFDFTYKEIANLLKIQPGTVASRLSRAHKSFKESFACRALARNKHELRLSDYPDESFIS